MKENELSATVPDAVNAEYAGYKIEKLLKLKNRISKAMNLELK